jgi:acyl-CoA thioesterase-1
LTAGYGLPEDQCFTALLQRKLDEKGYRYRVVNAGITGDTSAGGVSRIDWVRNTPANSGRLIATWQKNTNSR